MTVALLDVIKQLKEFSLDDLLTLQKELNGQIQVKSSAPTITGNKRLIKIPGAYQPSLAEIEASLAESFTPEQLAAMDAVDLANLPVGTKSLSEMVNEDREDRF